MTSLIKGILCGLLLFLLSACGNTNDSLSGKTFELYDEVIDPTNDQAESKYQSFMTLQFDNGNVIRTDDNGAESTYTFNDDILTLHFESDREELTLEFSPIQDSNDEEFSFHTNIEDSEYDFDRESVQHLMNILEEISASSDIYFIEKNS